MLIVGGYKQFKQAFSRTFVQSPALKRPLSGPKLDIIHSRLIVCGYKQLKQALSRTFVQSPALKRPLSSPKLDIIHSRLIVYGYKQIKTKHKVTHMFKVLKKRDHGQPLN